MPFSSGWGLFPQLCNIVARYLQRVWEVHAHAWLAWAAISTRHPILRYANFYQLFIQDFSRIASLLNLILKTISNRHENDLVIVDNKKVESIGSNGNKVKKYKFA